MLTDEFIKGAFIKKAITEDLEQIRKVQLEIAQDNIYHHGTGGYQYSVRSGSRMNVRSARLLSSLSSNAYQVSGDGARLKFTSTVPIYIRFLDMKKHGDWRIYNRQIWGILYNNAYQELRFGFTDEIRQYMIEKLNPHHYNIKTKV